MTKVEYTFTPSLLAQRAGLCVRKWETTHRWKWLAHVYAYFGEGAVHKGYSGYVSAKVVDPRADWTDTDWMFECQRQFR